MESAKKIIRRFWPLVACAALLLALQAQPAQAIGAKYWVGPNPNTLWTNPNNWSLTAGGPPGAGPPGNSSTFADLVSSTGSKTVSYDTASSTIAGLLVDATAGGTFTLSMPGNTLSVVSTETIGGDGKGQFVQNGGTNNSGDGLTLGNNTGSSGIYTLSDGSLSTTSFEKIGRQGTGLFNQTGGSNTTGGDLTVGDFPHSTGTYNLSGGHLIAQTETVGNQGTGTFNQSGGNNNVAAGLTFGYHGGAGTYNLNGGNLTATDETLGRTGTGTGTFTQNATSTNIISDALSLGFSPGTSGTYTMKGGYLQTDQEFIGDGGNGTFTQKGGTHLVNTSLVIGNGNNTNGAFTQSGGTISVGDSLILGNSSNSNGTYNLMAGSLSVDTEIVGRTGTGQFIQSSGTHTVANNLTIGLNVNSSGAYTLNAGQFQANGEVIGTNGAGVFTQNGGTNTVGDSLTLANNSTGNGTYNLVKGTLSVTTDEYVGLHGIGTFNQTGGTHTVTGALQVGGMAGNGTYNLQGGTLSAGSIFIGSGNAFNVKNTTTTVTGPVTNEGKVNTTNAKVTWNDNFTNNGAYTSNNSTQTFNNNLTVGNSGYLVGGSQDVFIVKNDFINQSTSGTQWNTVLSTLQFVTGADNAHNFAIPGVDNGPHGQASNFTWGTLNLTGQQLVLIDGNTINPSTALYAEAVIGATFSGNTLTDITNGDPNPINIYYNVHLAANAYLGGLSYNIPGGGMLIPHAPLPPSVLLLGSGLLGLGAMGWRRKRS